MSYPLWYTYSMNIKKDMKENKNTKATNLLLGAIYINATTDQPCRLVYIVPCQGVWLEAYDGQGYGELVSFDDVHYADTDEVQDFLDDLHTYTDHTSTDDRDVELGKSVPLPKVTLPPVPSPREYAYGKEIVRDSDGSAVIGWYDDNDGNDIRCRD